MLFEAGAVLPDLTLRFLMGLLHSIGLSDEDIRTLVRRSVKDRLLESVMYRSLHIVFSYWCLCGLFLCMYRSKSFDVTFLICLCCNQNYYRHKPALLASSIGDKTKILQRLADGDHSGDCFRMMMKFV